MELGRTLHVDAHYFKLPVVVMSSGATAYFRISAKNDGPPSTSMVVTIKSIKVWTVN